MTRLCLILALLMGFLAGCSEEATTNESSGGDEQAEVSGSVLGGTISDDMLPLEQLQSQSPTVRDDPAGAVSSSSTQSSSISTPAPASEPMPNVTGDSADETAPDGPPAPIESPLPEPAPPLEEAPSADPPAESAQ